MSDDRYQDALTERDDLDEAFARMVAAQDRLAERVPRIVGQERCIVCGGSGVRCCPFGADR